MGTIESKQEKKMALYLIRKKITLEIVYIIECGNDLDAEDKAQRLMDSLKARRDYEYEWFVQKSS